MTGNDSFSSIPSQTDTPMMKDKEPVRPPAVVIEQQKVTIAKNGKKRIQPMAVSPSASTTTANTVTTTTTTKAIPIKTATIDYDEPAIPNKGIGSSITGNKRKMSTDENTIQLSRKRPEFLDTAVVPPVVEKSQIRMGLPKVKTVLTMKLNPTSTIESHNVEGKITNNRRTAVLTCDFF
jgi:protein HIRA/HIR1